MLQKLANKARAAVRKARGDWRKHPTVDVFACCPVGDDAVWRIVIETVADEDEHVDDDVAAIESADNLAVGEYLATSESSDNSPDSKSILARDEVELICYGPAHEPLEIDPILFEDQVIPCDGLLKRRVTYSIRMSAQVQAFTLEVHHGDRKGKLVIGFERWRAYVSEANHLRRDAWYQPDYNRWLALHPDLPARSNVRLMLPPTHVAVQGEGVRLAPRALEIIAAELMRYPDALMVYTDSDSIDRYGRRVKPLFKPDFSPEFLQATNYIGDFVVVRRDIYDRVQERLGLGAELSTSVQNQASLMDVQGAQETQMSTEARAALPYLCALEAARVADEMNEPIIHIPEVLFHCLEDDEPSQCELSKSKTTRGQSFTTGIDAAGVLKSDAAPILFDEPMVDIIIPSKDHKDVLETCINSILEKATYQNLRIIVVENNSTEPETFAFYEEIMQRDSRITVIDAGTSEDFNYSRLINFGVAQGSSPYVLLLNNDTEVIERNFIQYMLEPLQNEHVGVVGAKLFFKDGLVQHVGMLIGPDGTVVHVNQDKEDGWPGYMSRSIYPINVSAVTGACQMVSRATFEQVGGYSEQFAVGYNDADFCCKVTRAGKRIVMQSAAKLYHFEFTSRGREENDPTKLERWRNECALFQRTWPQYFESGDPFNNPNLDKNSRYFSLPE